MDINLSCEKCKDELEIIEEYTERSGIEITVNPCVYCLEQAVLKRRVITPALSELLVSLKAICLDDWIEALITEASEELEKIEEAAQ